MMEKTSEISLDFYKVFYYVARSLSFSKASKELHISQSAVSQSIKGLERKLGQSLFWRSTKHVSLTPEGEFLLKHLEPALKLIYKGEEQLLGDIGMGGQLRIAASDTICRYYLAPFLKKYHERFPRVHIKIINQTSSACADTLQEGYADIIFTNLPNHHLGNYSVVKKLHRFHDIFVVSEANEDLTKRRLTLEEISNQPLLLLEKQSLTTSFLYQHFQERKLYLVPEVELTSNDVLLDLARIGLGVGFVPDFVYDARPEGLSVIAVKDALPAREIAIAYDERIPLSKPSRDFIALMTEKP